MYFKRAVCLQRYLHAVPLNAFERPLSGIMFDQAGDSNGSFGDSRRSARSSRSIFLQISQPIIFTREKHLSKYEEMAMEFSALVPELIVSDLQASLKFWCGVVGFSVWYDRPEEDFSYLTLGGAQLMLEQRSMTGGDWVSANLEQPFGRGVNFQIQVPSLEAVISRCRQHGMSLFLPAEERWYRRGTEEVGQKQCIVADPDGYLARCIQPLGKRPASKITD